MRPVHRISTKLLVGSAFVALIVFLPWDGTIAQAQQESLKGDYDLVWTRSCITEDTGGG